jgi:hypothetical protein
MVVSHNCSGSFRPDLCSAAAHFIWPDAQFFDVGVFFGFGEDIAVVPAVGDAVQRRLGDVQVAFFDQRLHIAEEEGQQQGADVRCRRRRRRS